MKEPYVGQVDLVSGEIAEDFAMYFTASEQTPSLVSLGVLVNDEKVEAAGGLIIQMLPGASEAAIQSVEYSAGMFMDISATMKEYHLEGAVNQLLLHWVDYRLAVQLERLVELLTRSTGPQSTGLQTTTLTRSTTSCITPQSTTYTLVSGATPS